jgi:hypothetical protein
MAEQPGASRSRRNIVAVNVSRQLFLRWSPEVNRSEQAAGQQMFHCSTFIGASQCSSTASGSLS